jgi:8-oxo-dGTP pyrophosphatase MutT (NUDIX family)
VAGYGKRSFQKEILVEKAIHKSFAQTGTQPAAVIPSATIVLVRDNADDLEVLLLRRARQLNSFAGVWVFPGGAVEDGDIPDMETASSMATARHTAIRELAEETGLAMDPDVLVPLSRWTAPVIMPKRFDTWFFLARAPEATVQVDQGEIHDYCWKTPRQALADHRRGRLPIYPPTWVTLHNLGRHRLSVDVLERAGRLAPAHFAPRVVKQGQDMCFLYAGDGAYDHQRIERPGPRHRLWVRGNDWHYERTTDDER